MRAIKTILMAFALVAAGCATSYPGATLTPGQALSLAAEKLPDLDFGQAYGVYYEKGVWFVSRDSAFACTNQPGNVIVAKIRDADGKVEIFKSPLKM